MPGLVNIPAENTTAPNDMTMNDSYERLESFVNTHQSTSQYFTIDDDHHGVGILCAHHDSQQPQQRSAATVRLNKDQIRHFMTTHGYQSRANLTSDQNNNPTFTESGFICTRTSSTQ